MKATQITDFFKSKHPKEKTTNQTGVKQSDAVITEEFQKQFDSKLHLENLISPFPQFTQQLGIWLKPLQTFINGPKFKKIYQFVQNEYKTKTVYPKLENIFSAFKLTPLSQVKVVIIGQDPYHGPNQAHGLCFSVLKPIKPPPSLGNIYKNLLSDQLINFKKPDHGDLTNWAKQGILLLNATLTVVQSKPNSHSDCGWQMFTDQVIKIIDQQCNGVVFLLWGSFAHKKGSNINTKKHFVLKTTHPSPLSAHNGFLTSKHFSKCNEILMSQNKAPINWNVDS